MATKPRRTQTEDQKREVVLNALKNHLNGKLPRIPYLSLTVRSEYRIQHLSYVYSARMMFLNGDALQAQYEVSADFIERKGGGDMLQLIGAALAGMLHKHYTDTKGKQNDAERESYEQRIEGIKDMQYRIPDVPKKTPRLKAVKQKVGDDGSEKRGEPDNIYPPW